jgi:5-formyltetrahydrofolate cyclo-ligase
MRTDSGDKRGIRRDILRRRDAIDPAIRKTKDGRILDRLTALPAFKTAHTVLSYASFRSEVDTFGIMQYCLEHDKEVVLPRVEAASKTLHLYEVGSIDELAPGHWGIPEPPVSEGRRRDVGGLDLIIVPGAAFDKVCNRLGYGGGYYDRLLAQRKVPAIALAYEEQVVSVLPVEPHDVRMDMIVTDVRILYCRGQKED